MSKGRTSSREERGQVVRRAMLWLIFLAPFFYLTYGSANWLASLRSSVPHMALDWERHIPFLAWSIIPYWSINLFYAIALFVNQTPEGVDRLGKRYLTAQVIAIACFLLFPLRAIFDKPVTDGLPGLMFDVLGGFDKPFNQAPSLHIALLIIIWDHMRRALPGSSRLLWDGWSLLIGLSVLTTFQHHAIDIPAGALLGLFALWLLPLRGPSPLARFRFNSIAGASRVGRYYLLASLAFLALAVHGLTISAYAIVWLWPALAFAIVTLGYYGAGAAVFQKANHGRVSLASLCLLAPFRLFASVNAWAWTRRFAARVEIAPGVFLGRFPRRHELSDIHSVIDLTAERIAPKGAVDQAHWLALPSLDLVPMSEKVLNIAAHMVEAARPQGPVLICCSLGFQRSARVAIHWLVMSGCARDDAEALGLIRSKGRPVRLGRQVVSSEDLSE